MEIRVITIINQHAMANVRGVLFSVVLYVNFAGYYCPEGSSSPKEKICPVGTFSHSKAASCTKCPVNTWTSIEGSFICTNCPAGFFCPGDGTISACPAGTSNNELSVLIFYRLRLSR